MREIDIALERAKTVEEVEALIKAGADPNAKDDTGQPTFIDFAKKGKKEFVEALIKAGVNVNVSYGGESVLFWAETPEIAKILIEAGTNADARDPFGRTVLMKNIDDPEMVKALVEAGVDVNARDKWGETALFYARDPEIVKILVEAGADINAQRDNGCTVLSSAVGDRLKKIEKVRVLLELGADVYIKDNLGMNALSRARSRFQRSPEIKALVEAYAREEESDKENVSKQSVESENVEQIREEESPKPDIIEKTTNGKDDTDAYLKVKERREILRKIVAEKIDKRDAKNPNAKKERVIKNKTLTKLEVAWKAGKSKEK